MTSKLIPFPEPDTWYLGLQVQCCAHQAHFPFPEPDTWYLGIQVQGYSHQDHFPFTETDPWNPWVRYRAGIALELNIITWFILFSELHGKINSKSTPQNLSSFLRKGSLGTGERHKKNSFEQENLGLEYKTLHCFVF